VQYDIYGAITRTLKGDQETSLNRQQFQRVLDGDMLMFAWERFYVTASTLLRHYMHYSW